MTGTIFDIHRGSLTDGPGIRTTVFLKGCPLRCQWCHNPESWSLKPQIARPVHPGGAPVGYGREVTVGEVMNVVCRDRVFYETSGGGVTLSGGEPLMQPGFCLELLKAGREAGISTCLDTSGFCSKETLLAVLPYVDLFHWDYKATGSLRHKELTGADPRRILENFEMLYQRGAAIWLRCPLVPGVNDQPGHLEAIARYARDYPRLAGIEILPYHAMGRDKYARLGLPEPRPSTASASEQIIAQWRAFFGTHGCDLGQPVTRLSLSLSKP